MVVSPDTNDATPSTTRGSPREFPVAVAPPPACGGAVSVRRSLEGEEDVERLKREYSRQQCELVNALSQLEYERSRANYIQAKVLHEEGVRWKGNFEAYKRQVDEQYRAEKRAFISCSLSRQVDESDLRADLEKERLLGRKKEDRAAAAEEDTRALLEQLRQLAQENKQREEESLQALKKQREHAEDAARLRDLLSLSQAEAASLRKEVAEQRRQLRGKTAAVAQMERSLAAIGHTHHSQRRSSSGGVGVGVGLGGLSDDTGFLRALLDVGASPPSSLPSVSPRSDTGVARSLSANRVRE